MSGDHPFYPPPIPAPARLEVGRIIRVRVPDDDPFVRQPKGVGMWAVRLDRPDGQLLGYYYDKAFRLPDKPELYPPGFHPSFLQPRLVWIAPPPGDIGHEARWNAVRKSIAGQLPLIR